VGQHVEVPDRSAAVPDGSAARRITIQRSRGEYLARVLVNDERSVVGELTE